MEKSGLERQTQSVLVCHLKLMKKKQSVGRGYQRLGCQENKDVISKSTSSDQMGDTLEHYEDGEQDTFPVFLLQKKQVLEMINSTLHNVIHESSHHFVEHKHKQL